MSNSISSMVRVIPPSCDNSVNFKVVMASNIYSTAHLIPDIPISSKEINTSWLINNHIDLKAWHMVYYINNSYRKGRKGLHSEKQKI
jgi:hypothetical protein